jgi:hypothetical protein
MFTKPLWFALGFVVATIGGHLVTFPLVEKYLWRKVRPDYKQPGTIFHPEGLTWLTGVVERGLYMTALYFGGFPWVGVWLGIKVIARWQREEGKPLAESGYDVWLIGSGVSLACAFIGACIALRAFPCLK